MIWLFIIIIAFLFVFKSDHSELLKNNPTYSNRFEDYNKAKAISDNTRNTANWLKTLAVQARTDANNAGGNDANLNWQATLAEQKAYDANLIAENDESTTKWLNTLYLQARTDAGESNEPVRNTTKSVLSSGDSNYISS